MAPPTPSSGIIFQSSTTLGDSMDLLLCSGGGDWSKGGLLLLLLLFCDGLVVVVLVRLTVVMSWMLGLLLSFPPECCLIKYF